MHSFNFLFFSLATDGSNDKSEQLYPLVVRVYSPGDEKVKTQLLGICEAETSSAAAIFAAITSKMDSLGVSLKNCISFASDNVMVGSQGGLISFFRREKYQILLSPCICHLLNLMTKKACAQLPISTDGILIDIFYYFKHSIKRKKEFNDFQLLFDDDWVILCGFNHGRSMCLGVLRRLF